MRKLGESAECSAALGIPKVALLFLTPGDMPLEEVSQLNPIADIIICWHSSAFCGLAHDLQFLAPYAIILSSGSSCFMTSLP